jgi:hypothetical protein
MELKEEISASHHINPASLEGDMTMMTKIALAAALVAGTASVAFAEGDSTIGIYGQYSQPAQQRSAPALTGRNVGLGNGQYIVRGTGGLQQRFNA